MSKEPRLCDYEDSTYRSDFWEGQNREYEDLAERIALRNLLPPKGRWLLDIGPGFGRLSEFYEGYERVIMLDYSRSLLRQAQEHLGRDGRILYVAASFYDMPLVDGLMDTAMMVRVMHHVEDVGSLLAEVRRVLKDEGTYVFEFASKRHLKAIARYFLRRQAWSPFDPAPYEFVEMNYDFHPSWMRQQLDKAGFRVKHWRTVSHFRLPLLKRFVPARTLAALDGICQPTGEWWQLTPSVFAHSTVDKPEGQAPGMDIFRCPACTGGGLQETPQALHCPTCGRQWPIEDGIYNFKLPNGD